MLVFAISMSGCKVLQMDFATFDGILCLDNRYCISDNSYLVLVLLPHLFTVVLAAYP